MGTRNLTVVVFNGEIRVAQYGQWDGYPSGNGVKILDFVRNKMNSKFFSGVARTYFISDAEIEEKWVTVGKAADTEWVGVGVAAKFKETNFQLSRDCGADILSFIQNSKGGIQLQDQTEFAGDSLFCEWAYVLDLDNNKLEVYSGFNEKSLNGVGRFAYLEKSFEKYKPIKLVKSYDMDDLPQKRDFVRELEKLTKD